MQLYVIIAFAFLFWEAESGKFLQLISARPAWFVIFVASGLPAIVGLLGLFWRRKTLRLCLPGKTSTDALGHHHRSTFLLRVTILLGFAVLMFFTPWSLVVHGGNRSPLVRLVADWLALMPFLASLAISWLIGFSIETHRRDATMDMDQYDAMLIPNASGASSPSTAHSFLAYFTFQFRHQFLTVAVPMSLILLGSHTADFYGNRLCNWMGVAWGKEAIVVAVSAGVFVFAPLMLRRIWKTHPMGAGELRRSLEAVCKRTRLRVREILVWNSGGLLVNAAVMGVIPGVRYILLSDALLQAMTAVQIKAVFGHEIGHVRHRHIPLFLLYSFVGWLVAAGVLELSDRALRTIGISDWPMWATDGLGLTIVAAAWVAGFGFLSRRLERQADVYGAYCVTPDAANCRVDCPLHRSPNPSADDRHVCATGAAVFASALSRVAWLNGVAPGERSWRHSSIESRIRFLSELSTDPVKAVRFAADIDRIRKVIFAAAIIGSVLALWFASSAGLLPRWVGG